MASGEIRVRAERTLRELLKDREKAKGTKGKIDNIARMKTGDPKRGSPRVRKLMEEMSKHGRTGHAAMKAGMDRKTARKYLVAGKLPSEMEVRRGWRTREDPFADHWAELEERLREAPELEAKTLLEDLVELYPDRSTRVSCGRCSAVCGSTVRAAVPSGT